MFYFMCILRRWFLTSCENMRSLAFWYSSSFSSIDLLLICSLRDGTLSYKKTIGDVQTQINQPERSEPLEEQLLALLYPSGNARGQ